MIKLLNRFEFASSQRERLQDLMYTFVPQTIASPKKVVRGIITSKQHSGAPCECFLTIDETEQLLSICVLTQGEATIAKVLALHLLT